jgi:hypothetical protein
MFVLFSQIDRYLLYATRKVKGLLKKSAEQFFLKSFLCVISELPGCTGLILLHALRETKELQKKAQNSFKCFLCVVSELPGWPDPAAPLSADWERSRGHRATGERQR